MPRIVKTECSHIEEIRRFHKELKLHGEPQNAILYASEELVSYLLSILRDDPCTAPNTSEKEWSRLLDELDLHGILPLLYWKMGQLPHEVRPPEAIEALMRKSFLDCRARSLLMKDRLSKVEETFDNEGIEVLVLKGPALALSVYPDPATRPYSDIDLLVDPKDFIRGRDLLEGLGYRCQERRLEGSRNFDCEETFIRQEGDSARVEIDLHWDLLKFSGIKREGKSKDLFSRAVTVKHESLAFHTLDAVDALVQAAMHLTMNHVKNMRLIWIYDIALLAKRLSVPDEWKVLQQRCSEWSAHFPVKNALTAACLWTGLQPPDGFELSRWPEPSKSEMVAWSHIVTRYSSVISSFRLCWPEALGRPDKIKHLFRLLFPPLEVIKRRYTPAHDCLIPLAYVQRWWNWLTISEKQSGIESYYASNGKS